LEGGGGHEGIAMKIVAREATDFRIICPNGHGFTAPRSSISVECPTCGQTQNTRTLVDRFVAEAPKASAA